MARTVTVEGDIASVDTRTNIITQGSVTAPSLIVPAGVKKIDRIIAACGAEGLADGSAVFFLRLGGTAIIGGEQVLMVSAGGRIAVQAGSDSAPSVCSAVVIDDADIAVSSGDSVSVSAEMAGSDLGTAHIAVTLVYA